MAATLIPLRMQVQHSSYHHPFRILATTTRLSSAPQLSLALSRRRQLSTEPRKASAFALPPGSPTPSPSPTPLTPEEAACRPLSCLPLSVLLRNIVITTFSTHKVLLNPSLRILSAIAYSGNPILTPSKNPLLKWVLKKTLFKQFCAGENPAEVKATLDGLRGWGIEGILLGWAREIEKRGSDSGYAEADGRLVESATDKQEIGEWVAGTKQALSLASARDCVCIKLTGAGGLNLRALASNVPPTPALAQGLADLAKEARERDITLVIDAEQAAIQDGIYAWTLDLQARFNDVSRAYVVGTYQAYLKAAPQRLADDLARAARDGFCLGVKLVRGAYLASDPRELMWDTKPDTDACYDRLAESLMRREWSFLPTPQEAVSEANQNVNSSLAYPETCLILATHNLASTQRAMTIRAAQAAANAPRIPMVYAQLMGMADHVSCELVAQRRVTCTSSAAPTAAANDTKDTAATAAPPLTMMQTVEQPRPYKYLVWGSLDECLKYLVRRAEENRDAVGRTLEGRGKLWDELRRRILG